MATPDTLDRLIVFEGIDGAGTTTQARKLVERMESVGLPAWSTSEPTRSEIGHLLRRVLSGEVRVTPETTAHLFAADRWEHVYGAGGIAEHHAAGDIVVCDRYVYSSLAYQTIECDAGLVASLNASFPRPGLLIFVDLDVEQGEERLGGRSHREIFERVDIQRIVRSNYRREISRAGGLTPLVTVAGGDDEAVVHRKIWEAVSQTSILKT